MYLLPYLIFFLLVHDLECNTARLSGITIDCDLKFEKHLLELRKKANRITSAFSTLKLSTVWLTLKHVWMKSYGNFNVRKQTLMSIQ